MDSSNLILNRFFKFRIEWVIELLFFIFFGFILFNPFHAIENLLTASGWIFSSFLVVVISLITNLQDRTLHIPINKYNRLELLLLGFLLLLILISAWHRATFLEEAWLQRWFFTVTVFIFFQYFDSSQKLVQSIQRPLLFFILFLCIESLYQYTFLCKPGDPLANSCFASRMWNINMLAQTLLVAIPFVDLISIYNKNKNRIVYYSSRIVKPLMILVILLSSCRSALVGFILLCVYDYFQNRLNSSFKIPSKKILLFIFTLFLLTLLRGNLTNYFDSAKIRDVSYRLQMWEKTISIGIDNPMGLGVNKFEFGYIPYKKETTNHNTPLEVDKTPHNEFLRYIAEEGWIGFFAFFLVVIVILKRALSYCIKRKDLNEPSQLDSQMISGLFFRTFICLLPELFFQFPTEMWFPTLLYSIALSAYIRSFSTNNLKLKNGKILLFLCSLLISIFFLVRNTNLVPAKYSKQYCTVFHDNWRVCQKYFQHHISQSHFYEARMTLRPIIRWQPLNYVAIQGAYLLSNSEMQQHMACSYWNLYSQKYTIPDSNVEHCTRIDQRYELIHHFNEISLKW